jgi:hypothetical protein
MARRGTASIAAGKPLSSSRLSGIAPTASRPRYHGSVKKASPGDFAA